MLSKERAQELIETYGKAWVEQDVGLILTIFAPNAHYRERAFDEPYVGHEQIAQYWQEKVVEEQSDIEFSLTNLLVSGDVIVAEWEASFSSNVQNKRIHLRSSAVFEIKDDVIVSMREYWDSEKFDL